MVRCFGTERMKRIQTSIAHEIEKLHQGLSLLFRSNFLMVLAVAGCIILCWLLLFAIAPLLLLGLRVKINVVQVLFYQFVLFFLIPLSPTPGGSGAAELGFAALLASLVPKHLLAVFVLLWRFLTYYLNLVVGGAILVLFLRK
ncbi:MAG: flippase-like domain-containing protein [Actinomycetota bacterium]|nr:flippase-like domain-containing protein [Actinomycetota bacterium]